MCKQSHSKTERPFDVAGQTRPEGEVRTGKGMKLKLWLVCMASVFVIVVTVR